MHVISANIAALYYVNLTGNTYGPIALRPCPGCVLTSMRALSRFHPFYTFNGTLEVTNWHMFAEISANTAYSRIHQPQPPMCSSASAGARPIHSLDCLGRSSDTRRAQQAHKRRPVAQLHAGAGVTVQLHLRSLGNPHERLPPASRRQNHSTALSHDGSVDEAVPVVRMWLR